MDCRQASKNGRGFSGLGSVNDHPSLPRSHSTAAPQLFKSAGRGARCWDADSEQAQSDAALGSKRTQRLALLTSRAATSSGPRPIASLTLIADRGS